MMIELQHASPIVLISVMAIITVMSDAICRKNKAPVFYISLAGLILAGLGAGWSMTLPAAEIAAIPPGNLLSGGQLNFGGYSAVFDMIFCCSALLVIISSRGYFSVHYRELKEFYSLMLLSVCGMVYIAHANNLLVLFLGIEIMSISFYVLSGFIRVRERAVEAAVKYFLLGSFATGFLIYGIAMVYGATGSLDLASVRQIVWAGNARMIYLVIGIGLMTVGLSFKTAAFPFHQWAPDVYTGAPTVVTAFMSTAGKSAALVAFIIISSALFPLNFPAERFSTAMAAVKSNSMQVQLIIALISAATMLIGNLSALAQRSVKRMLAYSSVAHAGYMLMGIVANSSSGRAGIIFYSVAYMFMQIGSFIVVAYLEGKDEANLQISDYAGLAKTNPALAAMMSIFMFSLAGLPPFAGFFAKYYLFIASIRAGYTWLTIVAVISSLISVYFYIGLVLQMYFKQPVESGIAVKGSTAEKMVIFAAAAGVVILGLFPSLIMDLAGRVF